MSLLNPKWKYTHSTATDIRKTFAKARRDLSKREQSSVRSPKLQLMPALSDASSPSSGHASTSPLYGTRSTPDAQATRKSTDQPALVPVRRDRRFAWP